MIDARSDGEFTGARVMAKRGGHVPGANHVEWTEFVDEKTGRFKSPAELKKLIESKRISLDQPCITYCQSGGRASVVAFGLELMGSKPVKNYYRSWSEWGNDAATPVEKK
jgi:thiosulfate/3-mercaptopyruvate sulfurtransferase